MHAYQTRRAELLHAQCLYSSYFDAVSLLTVTVGCIFPPSSGLLGGMDYAAGMEGVVWPLIIHMHSLALKREHCFDVRDRRQREAGKSTIGLNVADF